MRLLKWGSIILLVGFVVAVIAAPIGPVRMQMDGKLYDLTAETVTAVAYKLTKRV